MKKIHLTIPKPCHENWEAMTPADKGRFCNSCRKTVIDFSNMNDRQLIEFFKKPSGSLCGRFEQDQLNRDIIIPGKRIPWVKYFFQFSIPAFLFSMRAGAQMGKTSVKEDTVALPSSATDAQFQTGAMKTDNQKLPRTSKIRSNVRARKNSIDFPNLLITNRSQIDFRPESQLIPVDEPSCVPQSLPGVAGGVVVVGAYRTNRRAITKDRIKYTAEKIKKSIDTVIRKFVVYPNPALRNSSIKINLKKISDGNYTIAVLNMAGEIIQSEETKIERKNQAIDFHLKDIATGTYIIQVVNRGTSESYSQKIIVQ